MIVYLFRNSEDGSDFAFFHGTSNPLSFSDFTDIRKRIYKANIVGSYDIMTSQERKDERMHEAWKFKNIYSIRSCGQLISLSTNFLGFRLAELVCKELGDTKQGHTHFDEWSSQGSIELIIRNKDTDMIFR
ncbi:hypothetical protein [Paenibacillus albiflavus]|nr:hypothetical protein [Paenibacillus albiflavus]